jgi:hypothetical protein
LAHAKRGSSSLVRLVTISASRMLAIVLAANVVTTLPSPAQRRVPASPGAAARPGASAQTVVLIVADGLRWQEIFTGADSTLMNSTHGGIWADSGVLNRKYWRDAGRDRRAILFPFLWGTVAKRGQIFGNQARSSVARVTNGMAFSYPGYNEMLTGSPDRRINANDFGPNPNVTVFEWLNKTPEYQGRVAVYATWSVFKDIFNEKRSHLLMHAGFDPPYEGKLTPRQELLGELYRTTTRLDDEDNYDAFIQIPLLEFVKTGKARVLFVGYGETDNWAHQGRYDLVLESAHAFDGYVEQLWTTMQAMPEYRDKTTFIITTDHGRGGGLVDWKEHGVSEKGSENIWIAVMGPDTPALGERTNVNMVTQAQIAATIAQLLGKDFRPSAPNVQPALPVLK